MILVIDTRYNVSERSANLPEQLDSETSGWNRVWGSKTRPRQEEIVKSSPISTLATGKRAGFGPRGLLGRELAP